LCFKSIYDYKTYRSLIPESFSNRLFSYLNHIESNHKNVYWLNYYKDDRFIDDYFKDSDHLNILGATLLTEKLNAIVKDNIANQSL